MRMTVLAIINEVQRLLRLPISDNVTDQHPAFLLATLNMLQQNVVADVTMWDDLKRSYVVYTALPPDTTADITLTSGEIIDHFSQILVDGPGYSTTKLTRLNDDEFYIQQESYLGGYYARPEYYRVSGRTSDGSGISIDITPPTDMVYTLSGECYVKPPVLTAATDTPFIDASILIQGLLAFAKMEQGVDASLDMDAFRAALSSAAGEQMYSDFGDSMEAV